MRRWWWFQHRQKFRHGGLFGQPVAFLVSCENDRHPKVYGSHDIVGASGDDRKARFGRVSIRLRLPYSSKREYSTNPLHNVIGRSFAAGSHLPFVKTIGWDKTATIGKIFLKRAL